MAFAEDLTIFFDTDDFADEAVITLSGGGSKKIPVVFDQLSEVADVLDTSIVANAPQMLAQTDDLKNVRRGDAVRVSGQNFVIERITRADSSKVSTVFLRT